MFGTYKITLTALLPANAYTVLDFGWISKGGTFGYTNYPNCNPGEVSYANATFNLNFYSCATNYDKLKILPSKIENIIVKQNSTASSF